MKFRSPAAVAFWVVIAVVVLAYADILFLGRGLFLNDLTSYHFPMKSVVRDVIASGEFPYWNRYFSGGQPLAANPAYEVFYPLQWPLYVLPFAWAFQFHIVLHVLLAAAGMFFLLRDLEARPAAAAFGALAFVFGGSYLSLSTRLPLLFSISWMPLVLLFVRRAILRRTAGAFAAAAITAAMQLIIGEPTIVIQTWGIIAGYLIFSVATEKPKMRSVVIRRLAIIIGAIVVAATCVAAVQLLPGFDHARDSVRSRPFPFVIVTNWSMPLQRLFELFLPSLFRKIPAASGAAAITTMYPYRIDAFLGEIYAGLLVVMLAVAGAVSRVRGWIAALIGSGVAVIAAAGDHTPLFTVLYKLHLVQALRYPEKFVLAAAFVIVVFATITLDRILEGDERIIRNAFMISGAWIVLSFFLLLTSSDSGLGTRAYFGWNILRAAVVCGIFFLGRRRRDAIFVAAASAVLVFDLWLATRWMVPRMPASYFTAPPIASQLGSPAHGFRIYHQAAWTWFDNDPVADPFFPADGQASQPFWWTFRNGAFPNLAAAYGHEVALENDIDLTSLISTDEFREALKSARASRVPGFEDAYLRLANVGVVLKFPSVTDAVKQQLEQHAETFTPVDVVRMMNAPRYSFASRVEKSLDAADFRAGVMKFRDQQGVAFAAIDSFTPSAGEVVRVNETANGATLDVRTSGEAFLVASITNHKYWKAAIDGRPVPIIPANLTFQGVRVPPGAHTIRFRYSNSLVTAGGAITLLAIAYLLVFARLKRGATLFI